jgi:predicted enzyme related to lactoylglutathione lyase
VTMNLAGVLIGSDDPTRLVGYYTKLFGAPGFTDAGYTSWALGGGWLTIGPHDEVKGMNDQPGRVIWNIETTDLRGDFDRFTKAGATVVREPYDPDGAGEGPEMLIATFEDPDGNYFQLMTPMPESAIEDMTA